MKKRYFIAGTDTDVGKTKVAVEILRVASRAGLSTLGLKPVAAGAELINGQWRNDDALALMAASTVDASYDSVNPVLLKEPIAPHLAAERVSKRLSAQSITGYCRGALMSYSAEFTLIEGAGGWRVPLNHRETLADVVKELNLEVILVVGMRLGCLSHALLTAEAIQADGLKLAGWVANCLDPQMAELDSNIDTLRRMIHAPLLGVLPNLNSADQAPVDWLMADFFKTQ